jgi:hypothetical protein
MKVSAGDFDKTWSSWMIKADHEGFSLDENTQTRRFLNSQDVENAAFGTSGWDSLSVRSRGRNSRFSLDNMGIYE